MLQNDYLMRMILQLIAAIRRALLEQNREPGQKAEDVEAAVGQIVNMDPDLLFSLEPDSMVTMMQIDGSLDTETCGYVVESILYEADFLDEAGQGQKAALRREQAQALAGAYGYTIGEKDILAEDDALDDQDAARG